MRLGGHETFYPRPGWLTKGLLHLRDGGPRTFSAPETADALGVGRNMAKSIGWWLHATGLAERDGRSAPLEVSDFGHVIADRDPFMTRLGTWWLIHAVSQTARTGTSLEWFFSPHRPDRFGRAALLEGMSQELGGASGKPPPTKRLQREVATVLQTYAVPVPRPADDPEDNLGSPFQRLDLLRHIRATDRFERGEPTPAPPEALGLVLSALMTGQPSPALDEGVALSVPATDPVVAHAGAILGRSREDLLDMAAGAAGGAPRGRIGVDSLAGERVITVESARAATWAGIHHDRTDGGALERAA